MDREERGWKGMDWIHLAQDRDKWRAVVYTELNFRVPQNPRNFFTDSGTDSSPCSSNVSQSIVFDYASVQQDGALYTALLAVHHSRTIQDKARLKAVQRTAAFWVGLN
jgi:hypothetical protein